MRILVLYGPNLNLMGLVSRHSGARLTLDKLNRALRREAQDLGVELKIYQLQSEAEASKLLQRGRTGWAGVLLVPGVWARTGYLLRETLEIIPLAHGVFHLEPAQGPWDGSGASLFQRSALLEEHGAGQEQLVVCFRHFVARLSG